MVTLQRDRDIAIFGAGIDAVKCAYLLENMGYTYNYFVVNDKRSDSLMGKQIYVYAATETENDIFYIVGVSWLTYPAIAKQLRNSGKKEFKDFIYYEWINRDIVFLHGNCHMNIVQKYIESSREFRKRYVFYQAPRLVSNSEFRSEVEIFENIDIWIHQDIKIDNVFGYYVSDEFIRSCIPDTSNVVEITIPNLYGLGKGFFPQNRGIEHNVHNEPIMNKTGIDLNGMFCTPDFVLEECIKRNMSIEESIAWCKGNELFGDEEVLESFEVMLCKIREREKNWDIKISEFIEDNYKLKKLFFDAYHPTNIVLKYISEKILDKLNLKYENIECLDCLDTHEEPVYPSVARILGLSWKDDEIRKSAKAKKAVDHMCFDEYIKEYIWWCKK